MKHDNALYQGGGTIDLIAAARSAIRVARHPEYEDLRMMVHLKHNVGPEGATRTFKLVEESEQSLPIVEFVGVVDLSADDLVGTGETTKPVSAAEEFLRKELNDGRRRADEMKRLADRRSISQRTLDRARKSIGVIATQQKSCWWWSLPQK